MAYKRAKVLYQSLLDDIRKTGAYKHEYVLKSRQGPRITIGSQEFLNFSSSDYLGLSGSNISISSAISSVQNYGFGLSSGRIICGTHAIHKSLESKLSTFHGTEDSLLYSSCFDANSGIFEALLTKEDVILSDSLNGPSIVDGIHLSSAERHSYRHLDMAHLEESLQETQKNRIRLIVTEGVFSTEGTFAPLDKITDLAHRYGALVLVDDSHATGFIGKTGKGTPELFGVAHQIDVINSTLAKALGGASGGYTTGRKELIQVLRQKSRPYIFSNALAPMIVGTTVDIIDYLEREGEELVKMLKRNVWMLRDRMKQAGFRVWGEEDCPAVPIIVGHERMIREVVEKMMEKNVLVAGFEIPNRIIGDKIIRVQVSAGHTAEDINKAVDAFIETGRETKLIE